MKVCLIGLPGAGKTTIFSALTSVDMGKHHLQEKRKTVPVKDERLENIARIYNSNRVVPVVLEILDVEVREEGFIPKAIPPNVDALIVVVRAFEDPAFPLPQHLVDPLKQFRSVLDELILRDLVVCESRLEKLEKSRGSLSNVEQQEHRILQKLREVLSAGTPLFTIEKELLESERKIISSFSFLSIRPMIVVLNLDEEKFRQRSYPGKDGFQEFLKDLGVAYVEICGKFEQELTELPSEEQQDFLEDLGVSEPSIVRMVETIYRHMGLITFFTADRKETRARTLRSGETVLRAAEKVHSDMARGFIRAEIIKYEDLIEYGSDRALREKGLIHVVGKEYLVQDGDIVRIKFNV
ncbi:MAG: DUF933 domain-containing protein [Thermotogae bacterium]|nr:DUF933 domain-containing protein [Thermotogota bacterium]